MCCHPEKVQKGSFWSFSLFLLGICTQQSILEPGLSVLQSLSTGCSACNPAEGQLSLPFPSLSILLCREWQGLSGCIESQLLNSCPPNSHCSALTGDTVSNSLFCAAPGLLASLGRGLEIPSLCNSLNSLPS